MSCGSHWERYCYVSCFEANTADICADSPLRQAAGWIATTALLGLAADTYCLWPSAAHDLCQVSEGICDLQLVCQDWQNSIAQVLQCRGVSYVVNSAASLQHHAASHK